MTVRITDVAREAGVSLGTVSNALNHPEKVRPDTRKLIEDAIERLGYIPNQSARLLAGGRCKVMGLVLPRMNHGMSLQIASGATAEARKLGYALLITNTMEDDALAAAQVGYYMGIQAAGVLVEPANAETWRPPQNTPAPLVTLNDHAAHYGATGYFIATDNRSEGRLVTQHLISRGATRIAVVGNAVTQEMRLALDGVYTALADRLDIEVEVLDAGDARTSGDGYALGKALAQRPEPGRPDAVVGLTDVIAAGALAGIQAEGLSVPQDIMVTGCDGNPLAWGGAVPLTTCSPTGYEIGRRGVQTLAGLIDAQRDRGDWRGPGDKGAQVDLVRPFLLARESTGAAATPLANVYTKQHIPELNLGAYL